LYGASQEQGFAFGLIIIMECGLLHVDGDDEFLWIRLFEAFHYLSKSHNKNILITNIIDPY